MIIISRLKRQISKTKLYHVMVQEIAKQLIFGDTNCKDVYLNLIKKNCKRTNVKILAYCIMDNHTHILIYASEIESLSKFFRLTNTAYGVFFNAINQRVGYVFRDRYKSKCINNLNQLIHTINYIHDNPVKANICLKRENYKYSSYNEYKTKPFIISKKILLKYLKDDGFIRYFFNNKK